MTHNWASVHTTRPALPLLRLLIHVINLEFLFGVNNIAARVLDVLDLNKHSADSILHGHENDRKPKDDGNEI